MSSDLDKLAVENFRRYLRIPTISHLTDYVDAIEFLKDQAKQLELECTVVQLKPKRPVVIMKWPGTNPTLPSIALNNHMDVVMAEEDKWTYPPFAAHMDDQGIIYGRGTQDMKCYGIQYLEAIRRLKLNKVKLERTIVVLFVPDEELGGQEGMKLFVQTPEFRKLNIGFGLDESVGSSKPKTHLLYYAEKHKWSVKFHLTGDEGHGSLNLPNTAGEKMSRLLKFLYDFRASEVQRAKGDATSPMITSLNATMIEGGLQENIIPSKFVVTVDIRLHPDVDIAKWKLTLDSWCKNSGEGVWYEESVCEKIDVPTALNDSNILYKAIAETTKELGHNLEPQICIGITDARFFRNLGIPALGFSSITSPPLLHKHNEYISKEDFLFGITFYYQLLIKMCNTS